MVPFIQKRKKMEIFKVNIESLVTYNKSYFIVKIILTILLNKFFNEWPKSPEKKESKSKLNKSVCECDLLKSQVTEKDEIIKAQEVSMDENDNKIQYMTEQNREMTAKIEQLQDNLQKINYDQTAFKREVASLKTGLTFILLNIQ